MAHKSRILRNSFYAENRLKIPVRSSAQNNVLKRVFFYFSVFTRNEAYTRARECEEYFPPDNWFQNKHRLLTRAMFINDFYFLHLLRDYTFRNNTLCLAFINFTAIQRLKFTYKYTRVCEIFTVSELWLCKCGIYVITEIASKDSNCIVKKYICTRRERNVTRDPPFSN